MDDLEQHKDDLQAQYDGIKEEIARATANDEPTDEYYTENFAAVADALGIANFKTNPEKSLELLKEALHIRRDKVCKGQDDESVITSLNNVCILLRKLDGGHEEEAVGYYQREAVEMFCRLYPESRHLNAAANLNSLVEIMRQFEIGSVEADHVRYLKMAVARFKKYVAASAAAAKSKESEDEGDAASVPPDPVLVHFSATLKDLAKTMAGLPKATPEREEEIATCLEEASKIDKMFDLFEKNNGAERE